MANDASVIPSFKFQARLERIITLQVFSEYSKRNSGNPEVSTALSNPRAEDTLDHLDRRGAPHERFDFFKTGSAELKRRNRMRELTSFER